MTTVSLPTPAVPIVRVNGQPVLMEKPWYQLLSGMVDGQNTLTGVTTLNTMPGNITGSTSPDARLTATQIKTFLGVTYTDVSGLSSVAHLGTYASLTGTWSFIDSLSGSIEVAANKDYIIGLNMPFAFTANTMTTISSTGTCTLVTKKNTTAITGLSNSVSTTQATSTATAGNVFAVGDDVRITISANSSALNVAFCLKFTRTLP